MAEKVPWEWPGVMPGGLLGAGRLYLFGVGGEVLPGFERLNEGGLGVDVVQRFEGDEVGEAEDLVERKADGAGEGELVLLEVVLRRDEALLLVLVVDLSAQHVEAGAGAGVVGRDGLIERDLRRCQFRVHGFDTRCVRDAEQIGVAYSQDDQVACVFRGEFGALEVVLRGDVVFQRGDVDQIRGEVGAEVDDLEGADDGVEAGEANAKGIEVDLLDFDAGRGVYGGKKRLQFFETLAVGVFHGGGLEDEAEILAQAALDGIVEREVEDGVGCFAGDDAAVVGILGHLRAVLS